MLESLLRLNALYDFYGDLLSDNQKKSFVYYYRYDLSLSEISETIGISRQGVSDNLKRARNELENFEDKLGLYEKSLRLGPYIDKFDHLRTKLDDENISQYNKEIIQLIDKIIEELKDSV